MKGSLKWHVGLMAIACVAVLASSSALTLESTAAQGTGGNVYLPYLITAAYPFWQAYDYPPEAIPLGSVHEISHSFILPGQNGSLDVPTDFLMPELIARVHAANRKVTLGVGGAGSDDEFAPMVANPTYRATFVQNLTDFVIQQGYDGVVIDWEFPQTPAQRENLNALMAELRASLNATGRDLRLTIAVPSSNGLGQWFDADAITPLVDYYTVMTFNYHGGWSDQSGHNAPLYPPPPEVDGYGSVDDSIRYWSEERGVPRSKILMGLAFFGNSFDSEDLYQSFSSYSQADYSDIQPLIGNGYTRRWDSRSRVPYLAQDSGPWLWSYDDPLSIRLKCDYVIENDLAGVAIWDITMDLIQDRQELLEEVADKLSVKNVYLPMILRR